MSAGALPAPPRPGGLLAANAAVSVPAAAVVAMLLGLLTFDFKLGGSAFAVHCGVWLVTGLVLALVVAAILARYNAMPLAVLVGGGLGLAAAMVAHPGGERETLLFHVGCGIVVAALVQLVSTLDRGDVVPAMLMALFFFLVITTFWIAKPIKKGLLVTHYKDAPFTLFGAELTGAGAEQVAKVGNMLAAILAMTAFTWLSHHFRREKLVLIWSLLFGSLFVWYWSTLAAPGAATVWGFYLTGDMFNTCMVAAFFAFLNDSVVPEQARRIYALVVFGGVLGGALGTSTVRSLQKSLGDPRLVLIAAGATFAMGAVAVLAARWLGPPREGVATSTKAAAGDVRRHNPAIEGARLVFASRYLLCLVAIVGIYEFCSATLDYQWTATHERLLGSEDAIKAHQRTVYAITTWAALLVQLLVTAPLLRRFGVRITLLVLPLAFLGNSSAFLLLPTVFFAAALSVSDNSLNYSLNQTAREALYTPTSRDEKYKAKAFIDMFVQRFAKAVAVGLAIVFNLLGPDWARWLSIPVLLLLAVWIAAAHYAGKRFQELTSQTEPGKPAATA